MKPVACKGRHPRDRLLEAPVLGILSEPMIDLLSSCDESGSFIDDDAEIVAEAHLGLRSRNLRRNPRPRVEI